MYGPRRASRNWQNKIATVEDVHGYRKLECCPCIGVHDGSGIYVLVHGDDFHIVSDRSGIKKPKEHCCESLCAAKAITLSLGTSL